MAQMIIKRVGILSVAKIQAAIMAVFGLIIGVIYGLFFMLFGAMMMSQTAGGGVSTLVIGLLMMVGIPIMYGVIGFIAGAIGALIYNLAAGFAGGIELELESAEPAYMAPPPVPPQQSWAPNPYQSGQTNPY
jgi:hypothetical protein